MSPQFIGALWLGIGGFVVVELIIVYMIGKLMERQCPSCGRIARLYQTEVTGENGKKVIINVCKHCFRELTE